MVGGGTYPLALALCQHSCIRNEQVRLQTKANKQTNRKQTNILNLSFSFSHSPSPSPAVFTSVFILSLLQSIAYILSWHRFSLPLFILMFHSPQIWGNKQRKLFGWQCTKCISGFTHTKIQCKSMRNVNLGRNKAMITKDEQWEQCTSTLSFSFSSPPPLSFFLFFLSLFHSFFLSFFLFFLSFFLSFFLTLSFFFLFVFLFFFLSSFLSLLSLFFFLSLFIHSFFLSLFSFYSFFLSFSSFFYYFFLSLLSLFLLSLLSLFLSLSLLFSLLPSNPLTTKLKPPMAFYAEQKAR